MHQFSLKRIIFLSTILVSSYIALSFSSTTYAQTITLHARNISFEKALQAIRSQTGYTIFGSKDVLQQIGTVSISADNMSLQKYLAHLVAGKPIEFVIEDKTISFIKKEQKATAPSSLTPVKPEVQERDVTGVVTSQASGSPLSGVTVAIKGQKNRVVTDENGAFTIRIESSKPTTLVFTYVGMQTREVPITDQSKITVGLEYEMETLKDAVVTGIYQRKRESFSGSSSTFTGQELKAIGNQNILQSLKTLDPSFNMMEDNLFGSDPNRLPDIEIRGKSSIIGISDTYSANPNQPLFILDGFESTLAIITDLSMDRVASITLLKDAAATAIYGSKAANGVVVVETKKPLPGQLRFDYNLNSSVQFADLTDYNLMNAAEKLEYEKLAGFYGSLDVHGNILSEDEEIKYYNRLKEVQRGVNTYWANEPLRTAIQHRHGINAEGGDQNLRYMASLTYGKQDGVMKESSRGTTNGHIRLLYRKGNLSFSNSLNYDYVAENRESISFSQFVRTNPYHRKYNEDGSITQLLEHFSKIDLATFRLVDYNIYNPLYDFNNNNKNISHTNRLTNNFELEWQIKSSLRFRSRIGIRRSNSRSEVFRSPFNSEFAGTDVMKQGRYNETNGNDMNYDADGTLTFSKIYQSKHLINAVGGFRMDQYSMLNSGYQVLGFVDDDFSNPTFAFGYPEGGRATYQESKRRSASFYAHGSYVYDNRFLFDGSLRADGSSVFGASRQFTTIWSVGIGWNLHNETSLGLDQVAWLNTLKIRGSIGNPGNQNFSDYISMRVYRYNTDDRNPFGTSVLIDNFGNKNLAWQQTIDKNVGLDVEIFDNRWRLTADYFNKTTDPLLVIIGLPSSVGITNVARNMGGQITEGFTLSTNYALIKRQEFNWRLNLNLSHLKSEYIHIGDALDNYNENNKSRSLVRYYDGASPSDLWAVRSLGIDPATGREVFLNKNNQQTFVHNYDDEVVVGNSDPKLMGVLGTTFYYKGFSGSFNVRFRYGGQAFMQTLYDKVENLNNSNIAYNQDRRALHDRWQQPGDQAKFKNIAMLEVTPMSSRFVQDNNQLIGESFSLGYETSDKAWLRRVGASSINLRAYMNDIFHLSTIKNERGIDYPFARSVSFSMGLRF